jgi:hypothetical protein
MRRIGLWALGIGVLVSVGPLAVERGYAGDNDGTTKCSNATLKGRYLFAGSATLFPPAFEITEKSEGAAAGYHIFDGKGGGHDYVTFVINGIDQKVLSPNDLEYDLKSDCTGTYRVLVPPGMHGPEFAIFVSPNGDEMTAINIEGLSVAVYPPSRRVAPK